MAQVCLEQAQPCPGEHREAINMRAENKWCLGMKIMGRRGGKSQFFLCLHSSEKPLDGKNNLPADGRHC